MGIKTSHIQTAAAAAADHEEETKIRSFKDHHTLPEFESLPPQLKC